MGPTAFSCRALAQIVRETTAAIKDRLANVARAETGHQSRSSSGER